MAGRIPEKFIDDLLARVDIVDVIEQRVPLKKAGRDWTARCPFHDERSPSFTVSPAKQFYHCFGCGVHGSAIKFLMEYDRMEFVDAVEELAARVGLKVPYEGGRRAPQEDATDQYALLDAAAKFYQRQLDASDKARAYFDARGLDAQTLERFGLGYAPDAWDALKSALGTSPQRLAQIAAVSIGQTDVDDQRVRRLAQDLFDGIAAVDSERDVEPLLPQPARDYRAQLGVVLNKQDPRIWHRPSITTERLRFA